MLYLRLFKSFWDAGASSFLCERVVFFLWSQGQRESFMRFRSHGVRCLLQLIEVFVCNLACRDMESCKSLAQTVHVDIKFLLRLNLQVLVLPMSGLMLVLTHPSKEVLLEINCVHDLLSFEALEETVNASGQLEVVVFLARIVDF
jgi:hypothetical protein